MTATLRFPTNDAFLAWLSDHVAGDVEPRALLQTVCEALAHHMGAARVGYAEIDLDAGWVIIPDEWKQDVGSAIGRHPISPDSPSMAAYMRGEPVVQADWREHNYLPEERLTMEAYQSLAVLCVPLMRRGKLAGLFSAWNKDRREWTEAERTLVTRVGGHVQRAIDHARSLRTLRESEEQFRSLAENMPTICWLSGPDGRAYWMNRAGLAFFGDAGIAPDNAEIIVHPDDYPETMAAWDVARANGEHIELVVRTRDAHGVYRPLLSRAQPMRDASGAVTGWIGVQYDLTEERARKRSEDFLRELSERTRNTSNASRILEITTEAIGRHLGVQRVNFAEAVPGGDALVVELDWVDGLHSVTGATFPLQALGAAVVDAHLQGGPFRTDDTHKDSRFTPDTLAVYDSVGARAFVSIPMVRDGRLFAVLSVQQSTPRPWSDAEVRLLTELADRTWAILERARSEERMAESEALLASFLENAPIAMYLKDADGRYIRVNPVMGKVLNAPPETAIGKTAYDVVSRDIADRVTELDRLAMDGGVHSGELAFTGRDAFASVLSIRFPIATRDGKVTKLGGFTIDLTEHKRAEAALQKSREALFQSEKLNALGSLLAGVSHELNNPLSIVVAQAVMLERQARGTELAERGYKIRKAADRCARIVQTFLAMARQKRPERDAVDLNAVAAAAVELTDYGLRTDGIVVEQDFADGLPVIAADRDQLHQVIINMIVNAQQAMVDGAVTDRCLTLRTRQGQGCTVTLDIIDTGPGIPEEIGRRIFEPFFTTKPQGQGTGVGLSFSQGLAEAHGGTLELIDSASGAHFRLTLPVRAVATGEAMPDDEDAPAPVRRSALIVDDEREIAESLADFLSLEGFSCEIVGGGMQAQVKLQHQTYDLVVSDIRMPGMDGPQLYTWLKTARPDLESRMAFVTGDTLGSAVARFIAETKRPVLEKPFMPGGVRRLLKQMELA